MMGKGSILFKRYSSPCGELILGSYGGRLCLCDWASRYGDRIYRRLGRILDADFVESCSDTIRAAESQLDGYFGGERQEFDLPLLFAGSPFQKKVWEALRGIPYGSRIPYGQLARSLGMPQAARAVAGAVGANSLSVIVPCHRVTAVDGSIGGYRGGPEVKARLLELESGSLKCFFRR